MSISCQYDHSENGQFQVELFISGDLAPPNGTSLSNTHLCVFETVCESEEPCQVTMSDDNIGFQTNAASPFLLFDDMFISLNWIIEIKTTCITDSDVILQHPASVLNRGESVSLFRGK